jgi:diaminohydroxyphosphoribosylaminopyrimidine deaminase/5-amino-6-(5-phosphoribosylamino)uracil reductase
MSSRFDTDPAPDQDTDATFMAAAVAMGRRGLGVTAPNPAVGCVIVRDGVIVGRGSTQPGGRPHAETEAIRDAGELTRGATLYVSLEPCSHYGVTSPCADAIVHAGLSRVVSALEDPDIRVAGRGHAKLVEAGIALRTGIGAQAARRSNLGHILRVTEGRPMVTLKLAETADGYAAGGEHDPRLAITGLAANGRVQMMRAMHDAIMVGIETALADDPLLTVRLPGLEHRRPLRVVLDARLRLPLRSRLVVTAQDWRTLVIAGETASAEKQQLLEAQGVRVERVPLGPDGRLDLRAALQLLAKSGVTRVFSEGGPSVAASLIAQNLADEVILFTSPKPFGREGVPALDAASRRRLLDQKLFHQLAEGQAGLDHFRHFERVA